MFKQTNLLLALLLIVYGITACSQNKRIINNFPANYTAKIVITGLSDQDSLYVNGYVQIFDKKKKPIVKSAFEDETYSFKGNKEIDYHNQNFVLYRDFNFDGKKDFAIKDNLCNCYGSPSYKIYLNQGDNSFVYNHSLSQLTQNYCGIFNPDTITKTIVTYTQSGCCLHSDYYLKLENNEPVLIKSIKKDASNLPFVTETTITNENEKETTKSIQYIDFSLSGLNKVFSFDIADTSLNSNEIAGSVFVFTYNDTLYYAFVYRHTVNEVASYFPNENYQNTLFTYYPDENKLVFRFDDSRYEIYENNKNTDKTDTGINVIAYDMAVFSKAIPTSVKGTFKKLLQLKPVNLKVDN